MGARLRGRRNGSTKTVVKATLFLAALLLVVGFVGVTRLGNSSSSGAGQTLGDNPSSGAGQTLGNSPASGAAQRNLIRNGSFEASLSGWAGLNARLTRVRGGKVGRSAARVTVTGGARDFSIVRALHVPTAVGATYTATGWVRSPSRLPVCLRIREWFEGNEVKAAQQCVRPTANWKKFTAVRMEIAGPGREIDVYAYRLRAGRGSRFDIDGISLVVARARPLPPVPVGGTTTLIAAGDIAKCGDQQDEATARLLDRIRGTIVTLGDNVYDDGTRDQFERCYHPAWGRHKARTRPAPGNHDYHTRGAAGYFDYFGAAAGERGRGYYSYSVGAWHVISLNSNCGAIGGCSIGSPQERWLRADLQANRTRCTVAYWHHPRFSSGQHGSADDMHGLWQTLYAGGADVVLSAHDHNYERFAPQRPNGVRDLRRGIRQFVVGTGGADLRPMRGGIRNSQVRNSDTHGVLVLTLRRASYSWRFIPVPGRGFTDSGSGSCH